MSDFLNKVGKTSKHYLEMALSRLRSSRFTILPVDLCQPIFIVGCSRAGTTLLYKTFSESRELGSLHKETHDFWAGLHPLSQRDWISHEIPPELACERDRKLACRLFYSSTGKRRIVDKNNQNGLSIPYLHTLFPDAHFVFIKRSPGDNIESLIKGWGKASEFGTWSSNLPEEVAIGNGAYRNWCFFLAEGWRNYCGSSIEDVCAFQYQSMNQAILNAGENIPSEQWHEVTYETLIADPVGQFRRLFELCGINFNGKLETHCAGVLDRPYNTFSSIGVDKWKEGENHNRIENALKTLGPIMSRLGY